MAKNRKAAEAVILKWIARIDPSGTNAKMYKEEIFPSLSNEDFDKWMKEIEAGRDFLFVNIPNLTNKKVTVENNLKVAKEMGVQLFQSITQTDPVTGKRFTGIRKYLILHLPVRRQIQMITNKMSIQDADVKYDDLSGQVSSSNKGSSMSFPETLVLYSQGLDKTLEEFLKVRGGDQMAGRVVTEAVINQGEASLNLVENMGTRTKSSITLSTYMKAMHLQNNL